jgi:hypothetical protein
MPDWTGGGEKDVKNEGEGRLRPLICYVLSVAIRIDTVAGKVSEVSLWAKIRGP